MKKAPMSLNTFALRTHTKRSDEQLADYRLTLEEQWRHQVADLVDLSYDALSDDDDRDDDGSRATEQLLNSRLVTAARQQLQETEDALARIEDRTYGLCEACGAEISPQRLEILPSARLCVTCQAQHRRSRVR